MAKNENKSMLDTGQLWKKVFEVEHDALRIIHATDVETEISLSHTDGDSVISKVHSHLLNPNEDVNCSHVKKIMAYQDCSVKLMASDEVSLTLELKAGDIKEICALKLNSTGTLVGQ